MDWGKNASFIVLFRNDSHVLSWKSQQESGKLQTSFTWYIDTHILGNGGDFRTNVAVYHVKDVPPFEKRPTGWVIRAALKSQALNKGLVSRLNLTFSWGFTALTTVWARGTNSNTSWSSLTNQQGQDNILFVQISQCGFSAIHIYIVLQHQISQYFTDITQIHCLVLRIESSRKVKQKLNLNRPALASILNVQPVYREKQEGKDVMSRKCLIVYKWRHPRAMSVSSAAL